MKITGKLVGGYLGLMPLGEGVYGIVYVMEEENEIILLKTYSLGGLHRLAKRINSFYKQEKEGGRP